MTSEISEEIIRIRKAELILYEGLHSIVLAEQEHLVKAKDIDVDSFVEQKNKKMHEINKLEEQLRICKDNLSGSKLVPADLKKIESQIVDIIKIINITETANINKLKFVLSHISNELRGFGKKKSIESKMKKSSAKEVSQGFDASF